MGSGSGQSKRQDNAMIRVDIGEHRHFVDKESTKYTDDGGEYWFINIFRDLTKDETERVESILHSEDGDEPDEEVMLSVGRAYVSGYQKGKRKGDRLLKRMKEIIRSF